MRQNRSGGERAWALTLTPAPCPDVCLTELWRTADGGRTWTTLLRGRIAAIRFASADRGWIAIATPTGAVDVRLTNDGGATWVDGLQATGQAVGLDAATRQTAWVMTQDGAYCTASNCSKYDLFRTTDRGLLWTSLGNPRRDAGTCAFGAMMGPLFASETRGWLALTLGAGGVQGGPGGLLSTEDGGVTWRCASTPPNTDLVSAADPLHVWAASNERATGATTLYATEDGGDTWHVLDLTSLR